MPWDAALTGFGIAAAALLIGGSILLRYQRDRHHFLLMKTALEKGITAFPGTTPGWLISLRVGALTVGLGAGLILAGIVLQIHTGGVIVVGGGSSSQVAPPPEPPPSDAAHPVPPPPPTPEMERQRRIDNQDLVGVASLCAGGILVILGIVRIVFARIERRYTGELPAPTGPHD